MSPLNPEEDVIVSSPIRFDELLASTAAFMYKVSSMNVTGDPLKDLEEKDTKYFLYLAEHLLVFNGVLPSDWDYRTSPPET